jgi:hypothetical protein
MTVVKASHMAQHSSLYCHVLYAMTQGSQSLCTGWVLMQRLYEPTPTCFHQVHNTSCCAAAWLYLVTRDSCPADLRPPPSLSTTAHPLPTPLPPPPSCVVSSPPLLCHARMSSQWLWQCLHRPRLTTTATAKPQGYPRTRSLHVHDCSRPRGPNISRGPAGD